MLQQIVHKIQNEALKSTLKTFKLCKSSVAPESESRPGTIILFTLLLAARLHFRWNHHPPDLLPHRHHRLHLRIREDSRNIDLQR